MRWINPGALVGLLTLAVPILAHLFGRRIARRQRFPSLALLKDARPTPATRSRPSDLLLLVVRCGVIVAAVLGLAQPLWSSADRARDARRPVRAIIVDTSASMRRLTSGGTSVDQARLRARRLLDSARAGLIVETDRPGQNVAGTVSWLNRHSGLREIIVLSDFQAGAVQGGHLALVDAGIGARFERVGPLVPAEAEELGSVSVRLDAHTDRTVATWLVATADSSSRITVLAAAEDHDAVQASLAAIRAVARSGGSSNRSIAVAFPRYASLNELAGQVAPLQSRWQGDLLLALRRSPLLESTARGALVVAPCVTGGVAIAYNKRGDVVATLAGIRTGGAHETLVFACVEAGSLAATGLLAAVSTALDPVSPMRELEPTVVPDELLRTWKRPATEHAPRGVDDTSPDGRWFWLVAIGLLLLEEWIRRRAPSRREPSVTAVSHERVA